MFRRRVGRLHVQVPVFYPELDCVSRLNSQAFTQGFGDGELPFAADGDDLDSHGNYYNKNRGLRGSCTWVSSQHPCATQPPEKTTYLAQELVKALGDAKSARFYELVAAKIPERVIRETLAEIKADGARHPARLFTYRMQRYALAQRKKEVVKGMGG
jgi:hypothetical protein